MKISVNAKQLLASLTSVAKVISSKTVIPILSNVLCEASPTGLRLTASNANTVLSLLLPLQTPPDQPGAFLVNPRKFAELLKNLPAADASIEVSGGTLTVRCLKGRFSYPSPDPSDFPARQLPSEEDSLSATLDASQLAQAIDQVSFATAKDLIRPVMTGMLVDFKPGQTVFVASDTHKLAKHSVSSQVDSPALQSVVLPGDILPSLRAMAAESQSITLRLSESSLLASAGDDWICTPLLKGRFPAYDRVIPETFSASVEIGRADLLSALERVSLCSDSGRTVELEFSLGSLCLKSRDMDFNASASEPVPCDWAGEELRISFNADHLRTSLRSMSASGIRIHLNGPERPAVITSASEQPPFGSLVLLMPCRVSAQ